MSDPIADALEQAIEFIEVADIDCQTSEDTAPWKAALMSALDYDVVAILAGEVERAGSQTAWAKSHAVSLPYVNDVLQGRREPGAKILDALGLVRVVTYRRKVPHV